MIQHIHFGALVRSFPRLDAAFNSYLELTSFQHLDYESKALIAAPNKSSEEAAGDLLLFPLFFHAQCVHRTMHIFHNIYGNAIWVATKEFPELTRWADPYIANVGLKYIEVDLLVWRSDEDKVREIQREIRCKWGPVKTAEQFTDEKGRYRT